MTSKPTAISHVSVEDTLGHIEEVWRKTSSQRNTSAGGRVRWPFRGIILIHISDLPSNCDELTKRIRKMFEAIDAEGFVNFPVLAVKVDRPQGIIWIQGDESRIDQMRPLPA
jgi:hypothetical protein